MISFGLGPRQDDDDLEVNTSYPFIPVLALRINISIDMTLSSTNIVRADYIALFGLS